MGYLCGMNAGFPWVFHLIWHTSHVFIRILYIPSGSPDFSSLPEGFNVSDFPRALVAVLCSSIRIEGSRGHLANANMLVP